ncbi:MAG: hypothetical protein ACYSU7_06895 [Planctomycetota bacterium]|jgi:hypothetical protein
MDLPLTGRVCANVPSAASGGGLVSFAGASAAELQRESDRVLTEYGEVGIVPNAGGTPATMIRGMTLAASSSGTQYVCELQIEPDETEISAPTFPIDQQTPINALVGTFNTVGFSRLQFLEVTDPSEIARRPLWAIDFWNESKAAKNVQAATELLYEVAYVGPFNRGYVAALLWGFQDVTFNP